MSGCREYSTVIIMCISSSSYVNYTSRVFLLCMYIHGQLENDRSPYLFWGEYAAESKILQVII